MNFQLTDEAVALLNGTQGPIQLMLFRLGSSSGYIPSAEDTGIRGTLVHSGTPSAPLAVNANIVRYGIYLDYDVGPFEFGEIALFARAQGQMSPVLFALGGLALPIRKNDPASLDANALRIDVYLSMVGTNYEMWLDLAESNNKFRIAIAESPDQIPPSKDAVPNAYILKGVGAGMASTLAYTDRNALWNFDRYFPSISSYEVVASTSHSVSIRIAEYSNDMQPLYKGHKIVQFSTGGLYGTCRYLKTSVVSGSVAILQFETPVAMNPVVGDRIFILTRRFEISKYPIPIATHTELGAVIIGESLTVDSSGLVDVDESWLSQRVVTSVNGDQGNVTIEGLIDPTQIVTGTNLNNVVDTGLYYIGLEDVGDLVNGPGPAALRKEGLLEVAPLEDDNLFQRWSQDNRILLRTRIKGKWTPWSDPASIDLVPATTSTLGGLIVGPGLNVESNGLVHANVLSVNGQTGTISIDKDSLGLGRVENKSAADILSELTSFQVLQSLGYTPVDIAGDTMEGPLRYPDPPTSGDEYTNKSYVDQQVGLAFNPAGLNGQVLYLQADGSSPYGYEDNIKFGSFVASDQEFEQAEEGFVSQEDIFNSWYRISHANSNYNQPANISEISAWAYDVAEGRVRCTQNTATMVGFVSNSMYTNYELEARLASTANDDDVIGILIAFTTDGTGREHTLTAVRTAGFDGGTIWWELYYNFSRPDQWKITNGSPTATSSIRSWQEAGVGSTVRIVRNGDTIEAWCSQLASTVIDSLTRIAVDLNSDPRLEKFRGPKPYGFIAKSQQNSTYNDVVFSEPSNVIYDVRDGTVWEADSNGTYHIVPGSDIHGTYGPNRMLFNPNTRKLFYTVYDGGVELISEPGSTGDVAIATTSSLGVVQVGSGLSITGPGVLSAAVTSVNGKTGALSLTYADLGDLPIATASALGGIRVGSGLSINPTTGVLSADATPVGIASKTDLGVMQVGTGLNVAAGLVSVDWDLSPVATPSEPGTVSVGDGLSVDGSGKISLNYSYSLPTASASVLGGIRVGEGLSINPETGELSVDGGSGTLTGIANADEGSGEQDIGLVLGSPVSSGNAELRNLAVTSRSGLRLQSGPDSVTLSYSIRSRNTATAPTIVWGTGLAAFTSNQYIRYTGSADIDVVVPSAGSQTDLWAEIHFRQAGTGTITFVPGTGVTINVPYLGTRTTAGQGATITLKCVNEAGTEFDLIGQVEEAP